MGAKVSTALPTCTTGSVTCAHPCFQACGSSFSSGAEGRQRRQQVAAVVAKLITPGDLVLEKEEEEEAPDVSRSAQKRRI